MSIHNIVMFLQIFRNTINFYYSTKAYFTLIYLRVTILDNLLNQNLKHMFFRNHKEF